jgi:DNA topoisomerase-1
MKLFIVESPNKCSKLKKYLGSDYKVAASVGHIRQIPKKGINVDIKNDFEPTFEITKDKKKVVKELKDLASKADEIVLATDPDREGEAIAWHIYDLLPKKDQSKCTRVTFNEITKKAVLDSLKNPRGINMDLVNAQKARQILDRLIGYKVSPVLWYKANISHSSAGRVQSIALKIVCDRQKEIDAFKPVDYWFIEALLKNKDGDFWAKVVTKDKDNRYLDEKLAAKDKEALEKARYKIAKIERKEKVNKPYPPFDTNSLQAACSSLFSWSLSKSKTIAQKLYEQGLVTYIRSDSFFIAQEAEEQVRELIGKASSSEYLPKTPNKYKKKSSAASQEAHECIRPTDVYNKGDEIGDDSEKKMYKLIRDRFIACQMTPQIVDTVTYHIKTDSKHDLIAKGQTIKFDGWSKVYKYSKTKELTLPNAEEKEELQLQELKKTKHSTQPPARYNEGSLAKEMEKAGVGRPSTRDSIITAIQKKGYVEKGDGKDGKSKKALVATDLGMKICDYLQPNFKDFFMDIKYTSELEGKLDEIANGDRGFLDVLNEVYKVLTDHIKDAEGKEKEVPVSTGQKCTACKKEDIVKRKGRFGEFFACNDYKECKTVYVKDDDGNFVVKKKKPLKKVGRKCPECAKKGRDGDLIERTNKKTGDKFIGCSQFFKGCRYSESLNQ